MIALGTPAFAAARNTCKLCAPLGACLAFKGIERSIPLLHGSQGCSTYIRRYLISHFKEPVDIASSNFSEAAAVYGGKDNLRQALANVIRQYGPQFVGIATTCLSETIGDDVNLYLHDLRQEFRDRGLTCVSVSTPSYSGTHVEGYLAAVRAIVEALAEPGPACEFINLLPGMVSPADLRYLKSIAADFELETILLPDYSDTLDGPAWGDYQVIPQGGTPVEAIRWMGSARATVEMTGTGTRQQTAGSLLAERFGVPHHQVRMPVGVKLTDELFGVFEALSGRPTPPSHAAERGRLVDAYVDAHKYIFGKRVVVCGDPDLTIGLASMLAEIGMVPVLCATGAATGLIAQEVAAVTGKAACDTIVLEDADFAEVEEVAVRIGADLVIGSSKGYGIARKLGVPLLRVGFPIHDRIDGPRLLHVGYRGVQQLFDRIVNAILGAAQEASPVGYGYM